MIGNKMISRANPLCGRGVTALVSAFLLALLTSGCAPAREAEGPAMTLETAKSRTMANERDMIAIIAAEDLSDVKQNKVSNLLSCSNGEHLWTGQINAILAPGADGPAYVQAIGEAWADKDDWTVTQRTTAMGAEVIDITNPAGYNHGVDYSVKLNTVRIMSFSPCFSMDPPYEYSVEY